MDKIQCLEKIGEGMYGVVFKARHRETNALLAVKRISLEDDVEGIPSTAIREIALLKDMEHENIVQLKDIYLPTSQYLYLAFEYLDQDLRKYMDNCGPAGMTAVLVKSYSYQLLKGIAFCHSHRVLHRDLKPQNLLISRDGILKLADFGLARAFEIPIRMYTHEVVTLWYRCPEILLGTRHYSAPVDLWSVGCIIAEMQNKIALFPGDSEIDQLFRIFRALGTPNDTIWPGVSSLPDFCQNFPQWREPRNLARLAPTMEPSGIQLLQALLTYDPVRRISARVALEHPYFDELRGEMRLPSPFPNVNSPSTP